MFFLKRCEHAKRALEAKEMGRSTKVSINNLKELSEEQRKAIEKNINDKTLTLFSLPGGNVCVPLLSDDTSQNTIPYTHVMNDKVITWILFGILYFICFLLSFTKFAQLISPQ